MTIFLVGGLTDYIGAALGSGENGAEQALHEKWKQQFELLRHAGCDFAQGYLLGRAVAPDEFENLLKKTGAALIGV